MAQKTHGGGLLRFPAVFQPIDGKVGEDPHIFITALGEWEIDHRIQQRESGVLLHGAGIGIVAEQLRGEDLAVRPGGVGQQGVYRQLGSVADLADLHGRQPPVGIDQAGQILLPQREGPLVSRVRFRPGRQFLFIAGIEPRQHPTQQRCGPTADAAVGNQQQIIEKFQRLFLLGRGPIGEILLKNTQIRPEPGGVLLTAGGFQNVGEQLLMTQPVHQPDIVIHGRHPKSRHHLVRPHQRRVGLGRRRRVGAGEGHIRAEGTDVVLKVQQLGVDMAIAKLLDVVHVIQLAQNNVKGLLNRVDAGNLLSAFVPGLLYPEVGIHQRQRLRGQVFQLQIPHRVICRDVADGLKTPLGKPLVRIVIVEVGHPFAALAAELADVVSRRCAGEQGQIHASAAHVVGPHDAHSHMVDPRNVLQRTEGRYLAAKAHRLIDILSPKTH
ncbi:hypothetical protein SDC9_86458 [bioreactor metagenome]|uniref:Uncharacterized protein n=1 Tax=bioreactor metagenome TaxID=1076179 RepID=A0A644ZG05_9ZZZZ